LPRALNAFENQIRKIVSEEAVRGKIDVYIGFETFSKDDIRVTLNKAAADAYMEQLLALSRAYPLQPKTVSLSDLIGFNDIFTVDKNISDESVLKQMWETVSLALRAALDRFSDMRATEGRALYENILQKRDAITRRLETIKTRAPLIAAEYGGKLKTRLTEAFETPGTDEARLLLEIALLADKACIDEEITRLDSHVAQLDGILNAEEAVGRKLDFLVQEMNREVNTIGSKSNDLEITRAVVEIKSDIEKIREQVQNIE
jgi:uncharacterized protein (TIGR00255 family)